MEAKRNIFIHPIFKITAGIILINLLLGTYTQAKLNEPLFQKLFSDAVLITITGLIGISLAKKIELPLWWNRDNEKSLSKQLAIIILLGLAIILPNTLNYYYNQHLATTVSWLNFSKLHEPILVSLRAGLFEEVLYRLFGFTLITYIISKLVSSKKQSIIIGIFLSAVLFGLLHQGFIFAFYCGVILAYVYYKNGLLPAILIHFIADAIPFTLLYFWQR